MKDFILMKNKCDIFWYSPFPPSFLSPEALRLFKLRNVYVKVYGLFTFTALLAIFSGEQSHFYCFKRTLWIHERLDSRKEQILEAFLRELETMLALILSGNSLREVPGTSDLVSPAKCRGGGRYFETACIPAFVEARNSVC